jgi:hypothetical protein
MSALLAIDSERRVHHIFSSLACEDGYFPAVERMAEVKLGAVSLGSHVIRVITQNTHSKLAPLTVVIRLLTYATGGVAEHRAD